MMCDARLFTSVVKPDFTEHKSAVCVKRDNGIARVYFDDRSYSFLPDHQSLLQSSLDLHTSRTLLSTQLPVQYVSTVTKKYVQFDASVDSPSERGLLLYCFKFQLLRDLKYHKTQHLHDNILFGKLFSKFSFYVLFHKPIPPY